MTASDRPALVLTDGSTLTHADVLAAVDAIAARLDHGRPGSLITVVGDRSPACVLVYLAALASGHTVAWLAPGTTRTDMAQHLAGFDPDYVVGAVGLDDATPTVTWDAAPSVRVPVVVRRPTREDRADAGPTAARTSLLLSTSGSTGSARFVRLSRTAVESNADAIAAALDLDERTRAVTSLPLHYTYGLSVLNSTLAGGGTVLLSHEPPTGLPFWRRAERTGTTHVALVPLQVRSLLSSRPALLRTPTVRMVTVAGGALGAGDAARAARVVGEGGGRLAVMYGMTEATARVTVLPPEQVLARPGSVGVPVPGTAVDIEDEDGRPAPPGRVGRIVVRGPGVMLGYASCRADLDAPDQLGGILRTSDRGELRDGHLYVHGRVDRVVKLAGVRVELDDLERLFSDLGPAAAVAGDGHRAVVHVEQASAEQVAVRHREVCRRLGVPTGVLRARETPRIPRLSSGKTDYVALAASSASV